MTADIVVLTGGVGGAKLARGLARVVAPERVVAIVNTGDDFVHMGLPISPDIDTLLYTLSGRSNLAQGWGRADESWSFMAALKELGGPDWFALGDGDLALHVTRLAFFARGRTLAEATAAVARSWDVVVTVLPMSDERVATIVETDMGVLDFQTYFVRERCEPAVHAVRFEGADAAAPAPGVLDAIRDARAILIAPSNPWLSIDPILAVPGIRDALIAARAPVVAVSPLIAGRSIKGPTDKIMAELRLVQDNTTIVAHYGELLDGMVVDTGDHHAAGGLPMRATTTMMHDDPDRERVARAALDFALELAGAI